MKKWNLVLTLSIGLIILSCSSEVKVDNPDTTQSLISITKDYYIGNNDNIYLSEKLNFNNNKLINIQYSDGSYDEIDYEGNLISKISEFDINDNLEWTTTFTYDIFNRLIVKKVVPSASNPVTNVSRQKDIAYNGNIINTTLSWSDNGLQKNTISINAENLMTEDILYDPNDAVVSSYIFIYNNENLSKLINKDQDGDTFFEITYNYLNKIASDSYCYNKYMFGNEWKNNSSLNKQGGLGHVDSFEISKNYIKDYSYSNSALNITRTASFDYEFDAGDNIIKQTRIVNESNGASYKTITTFQYEL